MARDDAMTVLRRTVEGNGFFAPQEAGRGICFAAAQGCLDVLGALGAEAGGTLAVAALPVQAAAAVQGDAKAVLRVASGQRTGERGGGVEMDLSPLVEQPQQIAAERLAKWSGTPGDWAIPIAALWWQLFAHAGAGPVRGASVLIESAIPIGSGQAAGCAVLAACATAFGEMAAAAGGARTEDFRDPQALAQSVAVARTVVRTSLGAATAGAASPARLDVISALTAIQPRPGKPEILRFSAQPHRLVGAVPLPKGLRVLALDTGERNAAARGAMEELRVAGAMGMRIIETVYRDLGRQHTPLSGYLANVSPLLYRQYFRALLPRRLRGGDFLRTYGGAAAAAGEGAGFFPAMDEQDAGRVFRVRTAVDHLIAENEHAEQFLQTMEELADDDAAAAPMDKAERQRTLARAGRLLLASHHSYRLRLELSCPQADFLVDRLMLSGPERGVFGARITAGGGGGTVVALLDHSPAATEALLEAMKAYRELFGMAVGVCEA